MSKELEIAEKYKTRFKPQRYRYKMRSKQIRVGLGVAEDYPYDWFLGGVDSCQGDSGGPLWRNIEVKWCEMLEISKTSLQSLKCPNAFDQMEHIFHTTFTCPLLQVNGKVRATQIGVVSRGHGCAGFNMPGVFGSVNKVLPWIKSTVESELKSVNDMCKK